MTELEDLREDVLSVHVTLTTLLAPRLGETRRRLLAASRDRLAEGRYYVVACGEFKRGKSSLLNALVERPGLFPVDADLATCAVLSLEWGEADSAMVYFADAEEGDLGSGPEPVSIPMERVREFVTEQGNPDNAKNVSRVEMSAPIQELKSGLVLVDTPGTGGVNPAHSAATRAFLPHADAILFVASAVEPLGVAELDFLKLALAQCPIVVTALTMIDNVESTAQVVREARTRIAAVAGVDPADLVIVPVSSFRKRDGLDEHDPGLLTGFRVPRTRSRDLGRPRRHLRRGSAPRGPRLDGRGAGRGCRPDRERPGRDPRRLGQDGRRASRRTGALPAAEVRLPGLAAGPSGRGGHRDPSDHEAARKRS